MFGAKKKPDLLVLVLVNQALKQKVPWATNNHPPGQNPKSLKIYLKKVDLVQTLLYHGICKYLQIQHIQLLQPHMLQSQVNIYDFRKTISNNIAFEKHLSRCTFNIQFYCRGDDTSSCNNS